MIITASFDINNPELWVNRGLSYGDGLFETMRYNNNCIPLLDFHLNRLANGLVSLQLNEFDRSHIDVLLSQTKKQAWQALYQKSALIKLMLFRANQARTYTPLTHDIEWLVTAENLPEIQRLKPVNLKVSKHTISHQPILAGIKHLSRLEQVVLSAEINKHNHIDDLLLVDRNQRIIETSFQNVVMIKNNQLITPKLNKSGVKGVALEWLKSCHAVQCRHIKVNELKEFDGMMVCNSVRGFSQVGSIEYSNKDRISFSTSQPIHDKITGQWDDLFKS